MPKKSKKNPGELEKNHKDRTAHAVTNADKWLRKVAKLGASKKYALTEAEKEKIMEYLSESVNVLSTAFSEIEETVETGFKL